MKTNKPNTSYKNQAPAICFGIGLVALDVIVNGNPNTNPKFYAGGSCGNVLAILAWLQWNTFPIARLSNNQSGQLLIRDFQSKGVSTDFITQSEDGNTPIIIHRILKDANNQPKHRFEFKIPKTNIWLPSYKAVRADAIKEITDTALSPKVFYFDRLNRAALDLAKHYKSKGCILFFEPSSIDNAKQFQECLNIIDIIKFSNDRLHNYKELYPLRQVPIEIETLGANGLLYRSKRHKTDDWHFLSALHIPVVHDAAGAGDWCSAGIIRQLFSGDTKDIKKVTATTLRQAIQYGQFLAAVNCSFYGARGLMYNLTLTNLKRIYDIYLATKQIAFKKAEAGFTVREIPFNFEELF